MQSGFSRNFPKGVTEDRPGVITEEVMNADSPTGVLINFLERSTQDTSLAHFLNVDAKNIIHCELFQHNNMKFIDESTPFKGFIVATQSRVEPLIEISMDAIN